MDWSEEVRARLEKYPQRGGGTSEQHEADIWAALGEIKRLRAWDDGGQQFLLERDELRKEVERLRGEVARLANLNIKLGDDAAKAEAEVERLRAEMESCQGPQWYKAWKDSEAEVERLRARRDAADQHDCMYMEEDFQRMKARAERAEAAHLDLVMQVARKFPGETRHDTAKRYIVEREARASEAGSDSAALAGEGK